MAMRYNDCPKEYLFEDDRPFPSCHASTLVVLPNGEVLAAYFAGTKEKDSDCAIWSSRRSSGGVWAPPVKLADEEGIAHWKRPLKKSFHTKKVQSFKKIEEAVPFLLYN